MYVAAEAAIGCCTFCLVPLAVLCCCFFFFSSRRRHTRCLSDWSSDVCSSDLHVHALGQRTVLRCHLRDPVEHRLQAVGLLGALLALGAQLGGALLHRGTLLGEIGRASCRERV